MLLRRAIWQCLLLTPFILPASTQLSARSEQYLLQISTNLLSHEAEQAAGSAAPIELKVGDVNTGLKMPALGFGTCCRKSAQGPALQKSIAAYLKHGGRLIDTAIMYNNHRDVGEALQSFFRDGNISRDEVWVTSKIAPNHASTEDEAISMLEKSLQDLKLDYVDLFLIHAPSDHSISIWKGLIKAKADGKTKAIGVSNFNPDQIQELESAGLERPSVNQIEFHPWVASDGFDNVAWCLEHGVAITAYGSLGSNYHDGLKDSKVQEVAGKYGKTPAQVLLAWALHQGIAVVPGATSEKHIIEDLQADSFALNGEEAGVHYFN